MKRIIAFALALAVVFGVSFALYKPERIEAAARETMEDEWVGYFFALEPFDYAVGRFGVYAQPFARPVDRLMMV